MFASALRTVVSIVVTALVMVALPTPASAVVNCGDTSQVSKFDGGDGTDTTPYLISTETHLENLRDTSSVWSCAFVQTADIQMTAAWNKGIGSSTNSFEGSFDGAGFAIRDLSITSTSEQELGFFSSLDGATIQRVVLLNVSIDGGEISAGAFAGQAINSTVIRDIEIAGSIKPEPQGTDGNSSGGVVGSLNSGSVLERVFADVSVDGSPATDSSGSYVGGAVGEGTGGVLREVDVTGSVLGGQDHYAGGLVGLASGTSVTNSASSASVAAGTSAGGLVGYASSPASTISDSYTTSPVSTATNLGGLVGQVRSSGDVTFTDSFWDTQTTGQSTSAGTLVRSSGVTTEQMQSFATFAGAGWSIADGFWSSTPWGICGAVNGGYPFLTWRYSSDPCGGGASSSVAMAEFTFWLPDGRECSAISPIRVPVGSMFELPGADALCQTMPGALVAGWTIPGPVGFSGYGSTSMPFAPGLRVRVVDSQQFTVVPLEPVVSVMFDANVGEGDACIATEGRSFDGVRGDGRAAMVWVPRQLMSMARFPAEVVCAPIGYELGGWSDGESQYSPGDPMPSEWAESDENRRHLMAVWKAA